MEEITEITDRYTSLPLESFTKGPDDLNKYAIILSKDLNELADRLSRTINRETYPVYYNLNESTIVGLIVKMLKLHKEIIHYYENNKQDIITLFVRPFYEAFIILKYLVKQGEASQKHFRLISYRARYQNLKKLQLADQSIPAIKRQVLKLGDKMKIDGFTINDLEKENTNVKTRWKLDGKSFWQIHKEVDYKYFYSFVYGIGSDAVHGSWQEIMDYHLTTKENGYFGFLNYEKCDCRNITPLNSMMIECLKIFTSWNNTSSQDLQEALDLMYACNRSVYFFWESKFGEPA